MKKTIIAILFGAMFIATTANALALYNILPIDGFTKITNSLIDSANVTVYKFTDGKVTCYGTYTTGYQPNASISCVK